MTSEFAPDQEYGGSFACGMFLGDQGDQILTLSIPEQRDIAAYFHGCPKPLEVSKEYGPDGTDKARRRYLMCNFWFGFMVDRARELNNPRLAENLTTTVNRHEPVGSYELGRVPRSYLYELGPMLKNCNYALPRVLIVAKDIVNPEKPESKQDRFFRVAGLLDEAIKKSETGNELLANFSEKLIEAGIVQPLDILGHILPHGLFEEQGTMYYLDQVADMLIQKAPRLWKAYQNLSLEEMIENKIFDLEGYGEQGVLLFRDIGDYFLKSRKDRKRLKSDLDARIHGTLFLHGVNEELCRKVKIRYHRYPKSARWLESELKKAKEPSGEVIQIFEQALGRQLLRWVDLSISD